MQLIASHGPLTKTSLLLESELQRSPENTQAWVALGTVQAENEKEDAAIAALQRALRQEPGNSDAIVSLAVRDSIGLYDLLE